MQVRPVPATASRMQPASVRARLQVQDLPGRRHPGVPDQRAGPVRQARARAGRRGRRRHAGRGRRHPPAVRETAAPEFRTRRLLNTFFRQSPPAGNHDRGPSGRVPENRSILNKLDTATTCGGIAGQSSGFADDCYRRPADASCRCRAGIRPEAGRCPLRRLRPRARSGRVSTGRAAAPTLLCPRPRRRFRSAGRRRRRRGDRGRPRLAGGARRTPPGRPPRH